MKTPREEGHERSGCDKVQRLHPEGTFGHTLSCDDWTHAIENARAEGLVLGYLAHAQPDSAAALRKATAALGVSAALRAAKARELR